MSNKYPGGIITSGANAGYSVAFDGTGDYLTVADNTALDMEASNFTMDAFVYVTSTISANITIFSKRASNAVFGGVLITCQTSNTPILRATTANASWDLVNATSSVSLVVGQWNHIAVARSGTSWAMWVNGVRGISVTASGTVSNNAAAFGIGANADGSEALQAGSYISNARVVKGTAVYDPASSTISVPTQLLAITNTSLLTCNSPAIVDQSSNAFAITANGNAAASTFTPFTGYTAYNPALGAATPGIWTVSDAIQAAQTRRWNMYDPYFNYTTLLLHGNGTNGAQNNTFLDSSSNNFTITRNGNTTQGTFSPFSQTGWSYLCSSGGGGDQLSVNTNAAFNFGSGAYTMECWVYLNNSGPATNDAIGIFQMGIHTGGGNFLELIYGDSGGSKYLQGNLYSGASYLYQQQINFGSSIPPGWHHVAMTFTGSMAYIFFDGQATSGAAYSGSAAPSGQNFRMFTYQTGASAFTYLNGYMSNVRVIKGQALYTGNFTPSTSPLTATSVGSTGAGAATSITGTVSLLTGQSNRFVDNSSNNFTLNNPNPYMSVQAFSPFYPLVAYTPQAQGGSGYFDGTGDYLSVADNVALNFGTGDFEISCWIYLTQLTGAGAENPIVGKGNNNVFFAVDSSQTLRLTQYAVGVKVSSSAVVPLNAWSYVVASRVSSTSKLFLNGVEVGSAADTSNYTSTTALQVGQDPQNSGQKFYGYISGLRLVKGSGVTSVTLPTSPPTAITNTSLLTNFTNAGIVDSTAKNALETVGNAQISTTQSKFGGSSLYFDGTGDYLAMPATKPLLFGTAPFTIEGWIYLTSTGIEQFIYSFSYTSSNFQFYVTNGNKLRYTRGATILITGTSTLSANTWYHVALVRTGTGTNGLTIYLNGTSEGSATEATDFSGTGTVNVGQFVGGGDYELNGYIDDFRVTTGIARYTGNFTPQTSQWQDQ